MNGYKKIVVPYDGSTHAQLALDHAASLAKVTGGTLIILYVASLTSAMTRISGFFGNYDAGAVAKQVQQKGEAVLHKAKAAVPVEIETDEIFEVGSPGAVIISVAGRIGAELIVMGSRGLGTFAGVALGSVSTYVLEHAKIPVIVVK